MRYLLPLLLLLTACSSGPVMTMQNVDPAMRTDTLQASYDETFTAILDAYSARGFGVEEVNKDVGLARSGYKQSGNIVGAKARSQLSARVSRVDSARTRVQLTFTAERETLNGWRAASVSQERANELYQEAFGRFREFL
jgi:hypothetical protein